MERQGNEVIPADACVKRKGFMLEFVMPGNLSVAIGEVFRNAKVDRWKQCNDSRKGATTNLGTVERPSMTSMH